VRGTLATVTNTATNTSYTVDVRPFYNATGNHGQVVVNTTPGTGFTVNGTAYAGSAGLTALAALAMGTLTAATGTFDVATNTFTATAVFAGTGIPGAGLDSVEGTVTARSGNVLTVTDGRVCERDHDGAQFNRQIAVTVAAATTVTEDGQAGTFGPQDISVGQHVQLFGSLGTDTAGNRTLDASAGSARLVTTVLWGLYGSATPGVVTLSLQSLDGRAPSAFDFTGTGTGSPQDATAAQYMVSVPASLQVPALTAGSPVRFYGFVTPFGAAPPDFSAVTVVDFSATDARLRVEWMRPGATAPFAAPLSATNVVLPQATLQGAAERALRIGPERLDPASLAAGITVQPNAAATSTTFAIGHRSSRMADSFSTFGDLVTALMTDLNGTTAVLEIAADGPYDATTGVLLVNRMEVELDD
jgi:hypothetical protein